MKLSEVFEKVVAAHLHVHGSASGASASMSAQNFVAYSTGKHPVVWWTDSDWRMCGHGCVTGADFESEGLVEFERVPAPCLLDREPGCPFADRRKAWVKDLASGKFSVQEVATTEAKAYSGKRSLKFRVSTTEAQFQPLFYRLETGEEALRRSLAGGIILRFAVFPVGPVTENVRFVLKAILSEQPSGDVCELRYVLTRGATRPQATAGSPACVEIPLDFREDEWNVYEVDLTRDAVDFRLGGEDNGLTGIAIGVEARNTAALVFFDALQICQKSKGQEILEKQRKRAARYLTENSANHVGIEISYGPHIIGYGPNLKVPNFEKIPNGLTAQGAVSFIQAQGGLASICHPLSARPGSLAAMEFGDKLPQDPMERVERIAEKLLANRAFGANLIEVAYERETLQASLRLWDRLSAGGVVLTGLGVHASHSTREGWDNGFMSWIYAPSHNQGDLLESMKRGRVYFGQIGRFDGKLDLTTPKGARMGNMILAQGDSQVVEALVQDAPSGTTLAAVVNGEVVEKFPIGGERSIQEITVDTRSDAFVRVEVQARDGTPVAFSNPIYFFRTLPDQSSLRDRVIKLALRLK